MILLLPTALAKALLVRRFRNPASVSVILPHVTSITSRDKDYLDIHEIEPVHSISPSLNTTSTGTPSPYVLACARISLPDDIALAITVFASVTLLMENSFFDRPGTVTNRIPNLKWDKDCYIGAISFHTAPSTTHQTPRCRSPESTYASLARLLRTFGLLTRDKDCYSSFQDIHEPPLLHL